MPRLPRLDIPGMPQHLIQRGNNRKPCFLAADDFRQYLKYLRQAVEDNQCSVHAYVLMTNHVHLLATGYEPGAISRMMQSVGRRYVRFINARYERTGTLWEGRFRSCVVETDRYLLTCYRYIELNPVRASMVDSPDDYAWSSYRANALGKSDDLVVPHETFLALGETPSARRSAYRSLFRESLDDELDAIRICVNQGRPMGSDIFKATLAEAAGRRVSATPRQRGVRS